MKLHITKIYLFIESKRSNVSLRFIATLHITKIYLFIESHSPIHRNVYLCMLHITKIYLFIERLSALRVAVDMELHITKIYLFIERFLHAPIIHYLLSGYTLLRFICLLKVSSVIHFGEDASGYTLLRFICLLKVSFGFSRCFLKSLHITKIYLFIERFKLFCIYLLFTLVFLWEYFDYWILIYYL